MISAAVISPTLKPSHPETQSKDLRSADGASGGAGHFGGVVRFFDDQGAGINFNSSREAAKECSPRPKPWDESKNATSPEGAKENIASNTNPAA